MSSCQVSKYINCLDTHSLNVWHWFFIQISFLLTIFNFKNYEQTQFSFHRRWNWWGFELFYSNTVMEKLLIFQLSLEHVNRMLFRNSKVYKIRKMIWKINLYRYSHLEFNVARKRKKIYCLQNEFYKALNTKRN